MDRQLADYYLNPPQSYYRIADNAAAQYTREQQPFHCDLVSRITPGMTCLEVGCGTGHLCPHIESRGGVYTGVDYSPALLRENSRRFPRGRFLPIGADISERFDIVASLYTIEHVVDPPAYLERLWGHCKPGGLLAVVCPEFIECDGLPPSVYYGKTPRRLREKVLTFNWVDACDHAIEVKWTGPRWKARARATPPGAFWINVTPRVLHGADYSIDADAVHLARLKDLVWWLEKRGAEIVATSLSLPGIPPSVLRFNCYVAARKGVA